MARTTSSSKGHAMPLFDRVPNTMSAEPTGLNAAMPGLSRLAAAISGGKQTYESARDAEAKRQIDLRTGMAKMQQDQQAADIQSPDARMQRAMLGGGVPLDARGDVSDYLNKGYIGKYQLPPDQTGPTMPAPAWAAPDNLSGIAKQLASMSAVASGDAKGADDYAKGQQQQFETKIAKAIFDGTATPQQTSAGMAMLKASPIFHPNEYGVTNNYTGTVDSTSAPSQTYSAKQKAETQKYVADAGQASAAAVKSRAEAAQLTGAGGEGFSPAAIENAAARYNLDGTLPPMGMGREGSAGRRAILNRAAELSMGTDPAALRVNQLDAGAAKGALGQLTKSKAMSAAFEQTANANADLALGLSNKLDRTGMPLLNAGIQYLRTGSGSPEAAQFAAANETFVSEYAKIMSGGMGNGPVSDAARSKAGKLLTTAMTPEQYAGNVRLLQQEMRNRMKGFDDQEVALRTRMGGNSRAAPTPSPAATSGAPSGLPQGWTVVQH